jgi:hypothetical protein
MSLTKIGICGWGLFEQKAVLFKAKVESIDNSNEKYSFDYAQLLYTEG